MQTFAPRGKIHGPILPQFVLETSISFGAKVMYALLCNYASDNDRCWPSQATLATRLSCSVSSVKKYLGELVGIKLIDVRREQYRSSVYYMLRPETVSAVNHDVAAPAPHEPKPARHEATVGCRQSDSACPQPNIGYLNTLNKQEERNTPPLPPVQPEPPQVTAPPARPALGGGDSFAHDFEKAWEFYPRKEAKGLARSAWLHLQREGQLPTLTKLESSIRHFMASENWQREQGRFVPQMSNWLRGQRWLDDSVTAAAKEAEAAQRAADALQAMRREEETRKACQDKEREALRPLFDAFAEKFQIHDKPWIRPMAFGLWMHLHSTLRAPTPSDVPADNQLGIADFLQAFKRRCEDAAWRKSTMPERAERSVLRAFTAPHTTKPLSCGALLPHHPVFSRQLASPALARAM